MRTRFFRSPDDTPLYYSYPTQEGELDVEIARLTKLGWVEITKEEFHAAFKDIDQTPPLPTVDSGTRSDE